MDAGYTKLTQAKQQSSLSGGVLKIRITQVT
jgi:hypothetical protein